MTVIKVTLGDVLISTALKEPAYSSQNPLQQASFKNSSIHIVNSFYICSIRSDCQDFKKSPVGSFSLV